MTSYEGETRRLPRPCHICGGVTFTWGNTGESQHTRFKPDEISETSFFGRLLGGTYQTRARMCDTCRAIQVFGIVPDGER